MTKDKAKRFALDLRQKETARYSDAEYLARAYQAGMSLEQRKATLPIYRGGQKDVA